VAELKKRPVEVWFGLEPNIIDIGVCAFGTEYDTDDVIIGFAVFFSQCSSGNLNSRLMTSCARNIHIKNY